MRRAVLTLLLTVAVVLATLVVGWPGPAVVGAFTGRFAGRGMRPGDAGRAGALGWGALLVWSALRGTPTAIVGLLGGLAGVRGPGAIATTLVVALVTLGFAALLAWAAATCVGALFAIGGHWQGRAPVPIAVPGAASAPERVTLSGTADVAPARDPERAPAAQTP